MCCLPAKNHFAKDYFYQRMPTFFGHAKEQERMIQDLQNIYQEASKTCTPFDRILLPSWLTTFPQSATNQLQISVQKGIPLGDFPDPRMMQANLRHVLDLTILESLLFFRSRLQQSLGQKILTPMDFSTFKPIDPVKLQDWVRVYFTFVDTLFDLFNPVQSSTQDKVKATKRQLCTSKMIMRCWSHFDDSYHLQNNFSEKHDSAMPLWCVKRLWKEAVESLLSVDLPKLVQMIPEDFLDTKNKNRGTPEPPFVWAHTHMRVSFRRFPMQL